tara:strand:+ start:5989 stop:7374 length:1386 start_codon:yes stop_codon:yes gene_type:complete
MPQNTNSSAFLKRKPLENTNIGSIVEEHIRYNNKVKSDEEAKRLAREASEREFRRKLSNDRKKDLPELAVGDAEGYYKDQRVKVFEQEASELADLKKKYIQNGDKDALQKLDQRAQFYKSANETTKAFQEYGKYILENKENLFNPDLDQEKIDRFDKLSKGNYILTREGFGIPNDEGELEFVTPQALNQELLQFSRFSGKPKFEATGKTIADAISLDITDGSQDIQEKNVNEGILKWKAHLLGNPVALNTIAKRQGIPKTDEGLTDVQITQLALKLFNEHTRPDLLVKKNPLGDAVKIQQAKNAKLDAVNKVKTPKDTSVETISIQTDLDGKPIATTFAGDSFFVSFPNNGVKFGSPSSKGNVVYTGATILEQGGIELNGFIVDTNGNQTDPVRNTNINDINSIVKQINDGSAKGNTFDNAKEFYNKAVELFGNTGEENVFDLNSQPNANTKNKKKTPISN